MNRKGFWGISLVAILIAAILTVVYTPEKESTIVSAVGETCTTRADCPPRIDQATCLDSTKSRLYHLDYECVIPTGSTTGTCEYPLHGIVTQTVNCAIENDVCNPDTGFCTNHHLGCVNKKCKFLEGSGIPGTGIDGVGNECYLNINVNDCKSN